jgi:hypothetical protein
MKLALSCVIRKKKTHHQVTISVPPILLYIHVRKCVAACSGK